MKELLEAHRLPTAELEDWLEHFVVAQPQARCRVVAVVVSVNAVAECSTSVSAHTNQTYV